MEGGDDDIGPPGCNPDGSLYSGSSTLPLVGDSIKGLAREAYGADTPQHRGKHNGTLNSGANNRNTGSFAAGKVFLRGLQ